MSLIILPGLIDPHVHLRDPGQTQKEDFYTGTCAALAGGFTTILDMPNNKTPITTVERLQNKINEAKKKIVCDIGFYFGSLGDNFEEFDRIQDKTFGIKLYLNLTTGHYLINEEKLRSIYAAWSDALLHSRGVGRPILVHSEEETVEQVLKVVRKTKKKTHFCHISSKFELGQIIKAKEEGLPVTCGVTPHHLFLTENDVKTLGSFAMMKPQLRKKKDVEFLWKNLKYIDVIESDHAPHTIQEKKPDPPAGGPVFGVPGLETTLPLLLTFKEKRKITMQDILNLCFFNPVKIFNIKTDKNTEVEVDLHKTYTIENRNLKTKCGWSPFHSWKVKGKVLKVFIRGKKAYEDGQILVKCGFGEVVEPS